MLWTLCFVLLLLWDLGRVSAFTLHGWLLLLPFLAVALVVLHVWETVSQARTGAETPVRASLASPEPSKTPGAMRPSPWDAGGFPGVLAPAGQAMHACAGAIEPPGGTGSTLSPGSSDPYLSV